MLHLALVARPGSEDDGHDRVVTRSIRWRKEAVSLHTDCGVDELCEAFRTLVAEERLAGASAGIALGGEYCVTRAVTGHTDEVRREFAELEERSMRYLTLGPGPKALAGHHQQLDARHQHALLAVSNQRTLDVLLKIADSVGLQLESIEPSLLALSRAQARLRDACQEACLMIQLDEDVAELGICHAGRLLLDFRPGGKTNAEMVADVVALHLSRLQRYIERYHSYLDAPLRHVYLSGNAQEVARAQAKFAKLHQFQLHVLEPRELEMRWRYTTEPPGTELAAALGTAMALCHPTDEPSGPNLIENALAQQREPLRPVLVRCAVPFAATLLVAAGLLALLFKQWYEIAAIRDSLKQLNPVTTRATELRLKLIASDAKLLQLKALEEKLLQPDWQRVLNHISQSMPDDVWLDRITFQDAQAASLVGASYTDGGVYDFVGYLKQVPEIADIALEGTGVGQSPTGPTTNFHLQLDLADLASRAGKEDRHD
jgi:hypothetical protein